MADERAIPDVQIAVTPAVPIPLRYWWLKRIATGLLVLAAVLVLVRWWWGVHARKALQAEIDGYVVAGEPVYEADFLLPAVPDDQNAAVLLRQVAARFEALRSAMPDLDKALKLRKDSTGSSAQLASLLTATRGLRVAARQAARMQEARWRPDEYGRVLTHSRVIDLLGLAAWAENRRGEFSEALEDSLAALRYGRHISTDGTLLSAMTYASAVRAVGDVLEDMLASPSFSAARGADARLVSDIAHELSGDSLHKAYTRAMYHQRASCLTQLKMSVEKPAYLVGTAGTHLGWGRLIIPMVQIDGVRVLRYHTAWAKAMAAPDFPSYLKLAPALPAWSGVGLKGATRLLEMYTMPDWSQPLVAAWGSIARQRMLALALAVRSYEQVQGRFPADLNELVPVYLPALPRNPYVSDGATFELDIAGLHPCLRARDTEHHERAVFYLKGKPVAAAVATSRAN